MEEYKKRFPTLFKQILLLFKSAPTSNSWILEKLMEVFTREIAHNRELVKETDFFSFLNGFLEEDSMIHYPDFVMNNVALMAAEVLSAHNDSSFLEPPAIFIIRSPLKFWMVTKGHRVDVTFQIYKKWVRQKSMLQLLDGIQFDVTLALVHCLASPYNYTRQSAGDYFLELVKFTHSETSNETEHEYMSGIKSCLKSTICQLISQFNEVFLRSAGVDSGISEASCDQETKPFSYYHEAAVNYCRLLSECANCCSSWCRSYSDTVMFDQLVALLKIIASDDGVDKSDLFKPCTAMLLKFMNGRESKNLKVEKLIKLLFHVVEIREYSIFCDAVYMAHLILSQYKAQDHNQKLLTELSLLPLFVLFDMPPQSVLNIFPAVVGSVKSFLKTEQKSKPSCLLKVAVDNLYALADKQPCYSDFIKYLELKLKDPPTGVILPILYQGNIQSNIVLNYLVLTMSKVNQTLCESPDENHLWTDNLICSLLDNVQTYTKACLNYPNISSKQLLVITECYLTVVKLLQGQNKNRILRDKGCVFNRIVSQDIVKAFQFKMFDLDPNVREVAVTAVGNLYLLVNKNPTSEALVDLDMSSCLSSIWQCLDNKTEGVAMAVLEFLLETAKRGHLGDLLFFMKVTQEDLITKINKFLLSSPWDNIKPLAFNLLTRVMPLGKLVRYAEVCLHQDNTLLAISVLDFIQDTVFQQHEDISRFEDHVDLMIAFFEQGWGDLILLKANATDVCSFRKATSIMARILAFMRQPEIVDIIDKKVSNFQLQFGTSHVTHCEKSHERFVETFEKILKTYGHSNKLLDKITLKVSEHQGLVNFDNENIKSAHELLTVKRQCLEITIDDEGMPMNKIQKIDSPDKDAHHLSPTCLICSLIDDAEAVYSSEQNNQSADCLHYRSQIQNSEKCHLDATENKLTPFDECVSYIDSTKELPALTLSTEPFASQKQAQEILVSGNKYSNPGLLSNASGLFSWLLFQEMFRRIDPGSLLEEAQRSTDEYERDSLTLLYDMDQVMTRNFQSLQEHLERELAVYFLNTFSKLLNAALNTTDFKMCEGILKEVIRTISCIKLVEKEEENVIKFILLKRRSILKTPEINKSQFVLNHFNDRLNFLNVHASKGYMSEQFSSADGLEALLHSYMTENTDGKLLHGSSIQSDTSKDHLQNEHDVVVKSVLTVLIDICEKTSISDITELLACLGADEISLFKTILDCALKDWETIQEDLKLLLSSDCWDMFQPMLQLINSLTKQLIFVLFEKNKEKSAEIYSNITACFGQLEAWYLTEDNEFGSDHDDPTAIDCF